MNALRKGETLWSPEEFTRENYDSDDRKYKPVIPKELKVVSN
jgi:hypothetical protein